MKADIPQLRTLHPEPDREFRTGRYLLPDPETGVVSSFTRATTLAGLHEDHGGIEKWEKRKALEGLALDPTLLEPVAELVDAVNTADGWRAASKAKAALNEHAEKCIDRAGARDRTEQGTLLHNLTEWWDAGRFDEVRDEVEGWGDLGKAMIRDVEAYDAEMKRLCLECPPEYIERVLINTTCRSGGTTDRIVRLPDGRLVIGDLKTGAEDDETIAKFGILKFAVQLSQYAFADGMLSGDRKRIEPMPAELDRGMALVMLLPFGSGECRVRALTAEEMEFGWSVAQHAAATLQFRGLGARVTGQPYDPDRVLINSAGLLSEISHAESPEHLLAIWNRYPKAVRDRLWTAEHTAAAQSRKAELKRIGTR